MNNVLITAWAGYIGSHVAEKLIKNNVKVFIIDNLSTGSKSLYIKYWIFFYRNAKIVFDISRSKDKLFIMRLTLIVQFIF